MAKTLQELQREFEANAAAASPGTSSEKIWEGLVDLATCLENSRSGNSPAPSDVAELQRRLVQKDETINWQANILQQIKDAFGDTSLTMTQLPQRAREIVAKSKAPA